MDLVFLDLAEGSSLLCQDLLQKSWICVQEIATLIPSQNVVRVQHILYVFHCDSRVISDVLNRQILLIIGQKEAQNAVCPIRNIQSVAEITQWSFWGALSPLNK